MQYSKRGKAVLLPGTIARVDTILPNSSLRWVLAQPEDVLGVGEAFADIDGVYYSMGTDVPFTDAYQGLIVKKDMNVVLEQIVQAMKDELEVAFDEYFGTDTDSWRELDLIPTIRRVVAQASSRFTVGIPLCRNKEYLDGNLKAADDLVIGAGLASVSAVLRPIFGKIGGFLVKSDIRKVKKVFEPLYRKRLEILKDPNQGPNHEEPQDLLQMMLRYAQKERPHELEDLDLMTKRLVVANFGSMHQTAIHAANILLNILGSDAEFNTIAVLRDEVSRIMGSSSGDDQGWTKAKVSKLISADSVARETLRLQPFGARNVFRKVIVDGVVTDTGVELPKGSLISFLSQPTHTDEEIYEDALKYDPFRFSRAREAVTNGEAGDAPSKSGSLSFVATSAEFLPFGHGKHACPGRLLVDFELKIIIAYVLMNYDVKFPDAYGGKRPENRWMAEACLPPDGAKILVRRRGSS